MSAHHIAFWATWIISFAVAVFLFFTNQNAFLMMFFLGWYLGLFNEKSITTIRTQRDKTQPQVINYKNLIDDLEFKPK